MVGICQVQYLLNRRRQFRDLQRNQIALVSGQHQAVFLVA